jgi:hypothetical protein
VYQTSISSDYFNVSGITNNRKLTLEKILRMRSGKTIVGIPCEDKRFQSFDCQSGSRKSFDENLDFLRGAKMAGALLSSLKNFFPSINLR